MTEKMNRHMNSCKSATATWLAVVLATALSAAAAPVAKPDASEPELAPARSVFIIPTNPQEGCDPFFPISTRSHEAATAAVSVPRGDITLIVLKGISGTPEHRLAIINNRTFAAGEEGDVVTRQGRIHIRCVEIKTNSVLIESNGQSRELTYAEKH